MYWIIPLLLLGLAFRSKSSSKNYSSKITVRWDNPPRTRELPLDIILKPNGVFLYKGLHLQKFWAPNIYATLPNCEKCFFAALRADVLQILIKLQKALVEEGYSIVLMDAWRSLQKQAEVYRKKPKLAARPSLRAPHVRGIAVDMRIAPLDGRTFYHRDPNSWVETGTPFDIARRFGFIRPLKNEPWHFEIRKT